MSKVAGTVAVCDDVVEYRILGSNGSVEFFGSKVLASEVVEPDVVGPTDVVRAGTADPLITII